MVKKEPPSSPEQTATKHRPRKLDLTASTPSRLQGPVTAGATLGMHDVGIACLSPGFQTHDPGMREQLARSMSVRDQQRSLIEARLQRGGPATKPNGDKPGSGGSGSGENDSQAGPGAHAAAFGAGGAKTPMTGKKRPPPPGLSIVPPSHEQFAGERVIQSAPLHQTFTGRHQPPLSRHLLANGAPALGQSSHLHSASSSAMLAANRLPPIGDVFANQGFGQPALSRSSPPPPPSGATPQQLQAHPPASRPGLYQSHSAQHLPGRTADGQPLLPPSPGFPPPPAAAIATSHSDSRVNQLGAPLPSAGAGAASMQRPREYRSAEEAVDALTHGRDDLRPKLVHYSGPTSGSQQQLPGLHPPTPPSPPGLHGSHSAHGSHASQGQAPYASAYPPQYAQAPQGLAPAHQEQGYYAPQPGSAAAPPRRRPRTEYERDNGSPPLGSGPSPRARAVVAGLGAPVPQFATVPLPLPLPHAAEGMPFAAAAGFGREGRDGLEAARARKEEFLGLCARAWELLHG